MALNIKNAEVERLVEEVAALAGETKTEAVRRALEERKARLAMRVVPRQSLSEALEFLEREVWSKIDSAKLGRPPLTSEQEDAILGYGPEGV